MRPAGHYSFSRDWFEGKNAGSPAIEPPRIAIPTSCADVTSYTIIATPREKTITSRAVVNPDVIGLPYSFHCHDASRPLLWFVFII